MVLFSIAGLRLRERGEHRRRDVQVCVARSCHLCEKHCQLFDGWGWLVMLLHALHCHGLLRLPLGP